MKKQKQIIFLSGIVFSMLFLVACAGTKQQSGVQTKGATALVEDNTEDVVETDAEPKLTEDLYVVVELNTERSILRLYDIKKSRQEDYTYNDGTRFLDKYGKSMSLAQIMPGKVVQLEIYSNSGEIRTAQVSDEAWEYDGVKRFSIDTEEKILQIADTKYYYESDLRVFSDDDEMNVWDIEDNDILRIQGIDRKILSISIISGHGKIKLTNTDLFEGGWLSLSSKQYYLITKDMQFEVQEGTYTLAVANDGYGDSKEITVNRGEETVVDLNELKGEGPKYCTVTFEVGVDNAVMTLDGEIIDYTQPQQIKYGIHRLEIVADGYETWSKRLYVNSKDATVRVAMTSDGTVSAESDTTSETETEALEQETETSTETSAQEDTQTEDLAGSQAGSEAGSQTKTEEGSNTEDSSEKTSVETSSEKESTEISSEDDSKEKDSETTGSDNSYIKKLADLLELLAGSSSDSD